MVDDMDYTRIYNEIIRHRQSCPASGYVEKHHIVPRSLGGSDDLSNMVSLTAREHFICHYLLVKIHETGRSHHKMLRALLMMYSSSQSHDRYMPSHVYARYREKFSSMISLNQTGAGNSQSGTCWIVNYEQKRCVKHKVSDPIPDGWVKGRVIDFDAVEKKKLAALDKTLSIKREFASRVEKYKEWAEIYSRVGFDSFCSITGYNKSQANLVQLFAEHVESFIPQNGKKR